MSMIVGILTGILGVGGGIIFIAIIMIFFSINIKKMIGTATLAMFMSAVSGAGAYLSSGRVDIVAALIIGMITLPLGYYFAKLAQNMRHSIMYIILGSAFMVTAISEMLKIFGIVNCLIKH